MGENSSIKSIGRCIGNIVLHKLLVLHTERPESIKHLNDEIRDYSIDVFEKAQEFNWNSKDKEEIKMRAIKRLNNLVKNYPDLKLKEKETVPLIEETIFEILNV